MSTLPVVIGEGTYGCVHKPSLYCKESKINYKNKVSKVMKEIDANEELEEYDVMDSIDKEKKYYLGKPVKCSVHNSRINVNAIKQCANGPELLKKFDENSLLLLEDGGINLSMFADEFKGLPFSLANNRQIESFWLEAHRIFLGLKLFIDHKIIHHDLKPQNLVYNKKTNRINFIDFGFMTTQQKIIKSSSRSDNHLSIFHWSFPLEMTFYNKNKYIEHAKKKVSDKLAVYNKIIDDFKNAKDIPSSNAMRTFFSFVLNKSSPKYDILLDRYLKDYYLMLTHNMNYVTKYKEFIQKSVDTIDIYGVGIAFMYILNRTSHLLGPSADKFYELFYLMVCPDLNKRLDIDTLLVKYETLLQDTGILGRFNKHFDNHEVKHGQMIPKSVLNKIDSIDKKDVVLSTRERKDILLSPAVFACPPGNVFTPKTYNCVKIKTPKKCPTGKVLNPKTNRCIKIKTRKTTSLKKCPAGKVLNPKTNRCIKIKTAKRQYLKKTA
jgi:serine/threonine protein kinase